MAFSRGGTNISRKESFKKQIALNGFPYFEKTRSNKQVSLRQFKVTRDFCSCDVDVSFRTDCLGPFRGQNLLLFCWSKRLSVLGHGMFSAGQKQRLIYYYYFF